MAIGLIKVKNDICNQKDDNHACVGGIDYWTESQEKESSNSTRRDISLPECIFEVLENEHRSDDRCTDYVNPKHDVYASTLSWVLPIAAKSLPVIGE